MILLHPEPEPIPKDEFPEPGLIPKQGDKYE